MDTQNSSQSNNPSSGQMDGRTIGRNEPCPCKSGRKYKRCHGIDAAPKLSTPALSGEEGSAMPGMGNLPFDPSQLDPAMIAQFTSALQRLPRGQMQRLQGIMQKAMSGKDVTREAAELQRTLPPDFQNLMASFAGNMAQMGVGAPGADTLTPESSAIEVESAAAPTDMTIDQARKVIEEAVAAGKVSREQADQLLTQSAAGKEGSADAADSESGPDGTDESGSKLSKMWKSIRGKN